LKNNRGYTCSRLCGNKLAGIKRSINGNGQTEERRRKMSKMMHGEKSPNWRGGVSSKNERARHGFRFKIWREKVFKRDKYQCVNCGKSRCELHPDHIKQFAYHPSLRFDITNGRTLCIECHKKTPTYSSQKHVCCNKGR
jgi:5-methylcytosine-specific restriction endonuclease McrA